MELPDPLIYLQDVAIGEAKRRGHAEVGLAHLGVAALRIEEATVREVLGRRAPLHDVGRMRGRERTVRGGAPACGGTTVMPRSRKR